MICFRMLALILILTMSVVSTAAGPAEAMHLSPTAPSATDQGGATVRDRDIAEIQTALESKILKERLMDYGLYPEQALSRIQTLSDEDVHLLATNINALQAGGGGAGVFAVPFNGAQAVFAIGLILVIAFDVLVIYGIVVVILKLRRGDYTNRQDQVEPSQMTEMPQGQ
jgi:hypothetical protein